MEIFIMAESHLISQLTKLIENSYKEKAIIEHQLDQLKQQKSDLEDKILGKPCFGLCCYPEQVAHRYFGTSLVVDM